MGYLIWSLHKKNQSIVAILIHQNINYPRFHHTKSLHYKSINFTEADFNRVKWPRALDKKW